MIADERAGPPSGVDRVLGIVGILGGFVLLAAFVVDIPSELNIVRLVLFNLGAIAVVIGVHRRNASLASWLVSIVMYAAVIANASYLAMILLSIGRPAFPEPDPTFRLVQFYAGLAMWLADAAFGFVALRFHLAMRWAALALAVGSLLAILGMSHLELTTPANPTIFGALSLIGIALNGVGWILLGLDVMLGRSAVPRLRSALAP